VLGQQVLEGARAAVVEVNSKGGIRGRKIELLILSDGCNSKAAKEVANKFVAEKVAAVLGHV
jgi:branched-chain amino acid transport system substrate-binding protein